MANSFHESQRTILHEYVSNMPSFSPATAKIVQLANNLNTPANDLVSAIRLDPILTGKVLQLVNSAYFSLAQKVTSLNRALVYLGINTIKNLALSTAVMGVFDTKNQELANLVRPVWRHSLATAVCSKMLAKSVQVPQNVIEEYFIAGLLHDLGRIILVQAFFYKYPNGGHLELTDEQFRYGTDHCEVAANTLKHWKFSEELIEAIAGNHAPKPNNKIANFIHVADAMTYRLVLNNEPGGVQEKYPEIIESAWQVLGLTEEKALKELSGAKEQIEKAEVFLNISSSKEVVKEVL
jgi:HD-like signal output (HDOD) protein